MTKTEPNQTRTVKTRQFGEFMVGPEHIFHFSEGLLGFEDLRDFVLVSDEDTIPFKWLISLEQSEIGFPMLSPWHIDLTYNPGEDFDLDINAIMVVVTLEDEKGLMTANMKAPIIFDVKVQAGRQIILHTDRYSTNHVIAENKKS